MSNNAEKLRILAALYESFKWFCIKFMPIKSGDPMNGGGEREKEASVGRAGKKIAQSFDWAILGEFGRCERIRTSDPLHPMQMRYLAALHTDGVSSADGEGV